MSAWYYAVSGERHGPVAFSEIEKLAKEGQIKAGDLLWTSGFGDKWKCAWEIESLDFGNAAGVESSPVEAPSAAPGGFTVDPDVNNDGGETIWQICRNAKASLKGRLGLMIGGLFLMMAISMAVSIPQEILQPMIMGGATVASLASTMAEAPQPMASAVEFGLSELVMLLLYIVFYVVSSCLQSLVGYGYAAGMALHVARHANPQISDLFSGFSRWKPIIWAYCIIMTRVILWSLLFIIPGIVAAYSYSMTYYILAENPGMKAVDAVNESRRLMRGYKWKIVGMQMWFIFLVIVLIIPTLGLALLWLGPYMNVALAQFYCHLPKHKPRADERSYLK